MVRRLGAGGMAEVFLARSTVAQGLAKLLVIKKIHTAFAKSRHFVTMFVDEAKIALGLNHPNIVQVFDFGQVDQTFFLAMEYVEGFDLLKMLQEAAHVGRRVPYGLCAYIVQQSARGLDYAHRKTDEYGEPLGIVHRDVSPQNILVSWDGGVKIVDFGIARTRDVQEEEGVVKGKFAYMSPEQARGMPVDQRSDIYSLGVVLFELACARPLFPGKGKEVLELVKTGAIPRPSDCAPDLPPELEAIILKALSYNRDDRYAETRDLQTALGRFQLRWAQAQDEPYDSSTLARFVTELVPRGTPLRPTPVRPSVSGSMPRVVAPDPGPTPVGKRNADGTPLLAASGTQLPAVLAPSDGDGADEAAPVAPPTEVRERRSVLLVEARLAGFEVLRQRVGEERARATVADFFRIVEHVAYKHDAHPQRAPGMGAGGVPGLAYVVGLPVAGDDDPSRAIQLALALVDSLDGIGRDVEPELRLSVGIQRGNAVVRRRGAAWKHELEDDTSKMALRLAHAARGGEVLVGGDVYRLARTDWNFEELASIDLGTEPRALPSADDNAAVRARVHRLRGPKERVQRMRERSATSALVGRELELKALKDIYRDVLVSRKKQYLIVVGDAGVGKRSLVTNFLQGIPAGEATILRAAARAPTRDTPLAIVADLARDLLGLAEGAEPREIQRRIQMSAAMFYPDDLAGREAQGLQQAASLLLGVKDAAQDGIEFDAEELRHRVTQAFRRIEERLSRERPLVIVMEDVHWTDQASWHVFTELLAIPTDQPILGLATTRPEERILDAARSTGTRVLMLGDLALDDRTQLILDRFAPGEDARSLATAILAKTGGNPFFIQETIEALVERGALTLSPEHPGKLVRARRDAEVLLPTSVEALVAVRLDHLPDGPKATLARAAVIGRDFATADLEALLGRPAAADLALLVTRGLCDVTPAGHTFRNDLTLQVAYELLPPDDRRALHLACAARIAQAPAYRAGQDDARIARHHDVAGDAVGAAHRFLSAGLHSAEMCATRDASAHLSRALDLLPADAHAERFAAHAERETIFRGQAQRIARLREIQLMLRAAEALGDKARTTLALLRLAQLYFDAGRPRAARRALDPAVKAAEEAGDRLVWASGLRLTALLERTGGNLGGALELCERALALLGDDRPSLLERAEILVTRAGALWNMSRLREALEAAAEALVILRRLKNVRLQARVINLMGIVFSELGEYEEAISHYRQAIKLEDEVGNRAGIGQKLSNLGQLYIEIGDLVRAEQYLKKAEALARHHKDQPSLNDVMTSLAQIHLKRGAAAEARVLCEAGLDLAVRTGNRYQEIRALVYLALARLGAGGAPAAALEAAREATRLARESQVPLGEIHGVAAEALALAATGDAAGAADRATAAVRLLDSTKNPEGADEILHIQARLCRAAGRTEESQAALARAYREVQAKARRLRDPALRARLLECAPAREIVRDHAMLEPPG